MKTLYKLFFTLLIVAGFCSCDDYLDKEPSSTIPPEAYFKTESQLEAYTLKSYESVFTLMSKGYYDPKTEVDISDDQIPETAPERYYEGGWRVAQDNANWDFADIYRINAFLSFVMPRYGNDINGTENIITGTLKNIKHLIGEIKEVLFWRQFASGVRMHQINAGATDGNWGLGLTRGCVQNFLMNDGTPVYTHIQNDDYGKPLSDTDLYKGDNTLATVVVNRDPRLTLFLKVNGQTNVKGTVKAGIDKTVPAPNFTDATGQKHYVTGYTIRKGGSQDAAQYPDINSGSTGYIMMRSVEALLNYIEASYELRGRLDDTAKEYWRLIRTRNAGMSNDIDKTIETTDMNKEAANDWGAYSGGSLLTDKILYNIRRERRCELLSEGFRYMDLCRWRAMDQLISKPYIPEGIHLWNTPMESLYASGKLITDGSTKANMSPASNSEYVRPFQVRKTQNGYYGYTWKMAHYLEPIGAGELLITSVDGQSLSQSPLYQNPYWPTTANLPAEK